MSPRYGTHASGRTSVFSSVRECLAGEGKIRTSDVEGDCRQIGVSGELCCSGQENGTVSAASAIFKPVGHISTFSNANPNLGTRPSNMGFNSNLCNALWRQTFAGAEHFRVIPGLAGDSPIVPDCIRCHASGKSADASILLVIIRISLSGRMPNAQPWASECPPRAQGIAPKRWSNSIQKLDKTIK